MLSLMLTAPVPRKVRLALPVVAEIGELTVMLPTVPVPEMLVLPVGLVAFAVLISTLVPAFRAVLIRPAAVASMV